MHEGSRLSKIIKLILELFTTPMKGDEKVINYLAKIKNIKSQLDGCKCDLIKDKLLYFIIQINIHERFRNFISILNSKYQNEDDLPDLSTLSSLLIQEEQVMLLV